MSYKNSDITWANAQTWDAEAGFLAAGLAAAQATLYLERGDLKAPTAVQWAAETLISAESWGLPPVLLSKTWCSACGHCTEEAEIIFDLAARRTIMVRQGSGVPVSFNRWHPASEAIRYGLTIPEHCSGSGHSLTAELVLSWGL